MQFHKKGWANPQEDALRKQGTFHQWHISLIDISLEDFLFSTLVIPNLGEYGGWKDCASWFQSLSLCTKLSRPFYLSSPLAFLKWVERRDLSEIGIIHWMEALFKNQGAKLDSHKKFYPSSYTRIITVVSEFLSRDGNQNHLQNSDRPAAQSTLRYIELVFLAHRIIPLSRVSFMCNPS